MPEISVIIPTYNRADLVAETLESVAAQTFRDWECLIVDDGSTDNTREVVQRFLAADERFRYVWQENTSASAARNHGIDLARGEFIAFLDSDDLWPPDKLEWQIDVLKKNPNAVLVYSNAFVFKGGDTSDGYIYQEDRLNKPSGKVFEIFISNSAILSPGAALVRTESIRSLGGFDRSLPSAEDWDMWISLSKIGEFVFDPRVGLYYRAHEGNKSGNTLRHYASARRVVQKHLRGVPLPKRITLSRSVRQYIQINYTHRLRSLAFELTSAGDWKRARQVWKLLAALNPGQLRDRGVLLNTLWSLLPTDAAPIWRARRN